MKDGFERREALLRQQEEIKKQINVLDTKLNDLKLLYDQYFVGMERTEPIKLRKEIQEIVRSLSSHYIKSTALKFKLNTIISKHNSYSKLWDRIVREIEEGRYKRDVFRMKVKDWQSAHRKKEEDKVTEVKVKVDPISMLYSQYTESKRKYNEPTQSLNKEKFAERLNKQVAEIKKKFRCKSVSFKVVVEEGKTKLKATPKN